MTEDEQHYWSALRNLHPRKAAGLERLQGHPNWPSLCDQAGRTPGMWAVVKEPSLWKILRPALRRPLVQALTEEGRSLWFYMVIGHESFLTEADRCSRIQERVRWLKGIVPDVRQGVGHDEGLVPALLSDAGIREVAHLQGDTTSSTSGLVYPVWWEVLASTVPANALWSAPSNVEREAAARVWRGALLHRSQAVHASNGGVRPSPTWVADDDVAALAASRLVSDAAARTLKATGRLPPMSPEWRTAVGAAITANLVSWDPRISAAVRIASHLWAGAAFPGPERPQDVGLTDAEAWPVLWVHLQAAQLRQTLPAACESRRQRL